MLTEEQARQIKQQIFQQIDMWPAEKSEQAKAAKQQIANMTKEQLEQFLIQNKLIRAPGSTSAATQQAEIGAGQPGQAVEPQQCIFCLISQGQVKSSKFYEDSDIIAVLEINPVSKGHALIIPKKHLSNLQQLPSDIFEKIKKISNIMKSVLSCQSIEILTSTKFAHLIINLIPDYKDGKVILDFQRQKADEKELQELTSVFSEKITQQQQAEERRRQQEEAQREQEKQELYMPRRVP